MERRRIVPWASWKEWRHVYEGLYSEQRDRVRDAVGRVKAWIARGNVPVSVDSTASIIELILLDEDTLLQKKSPASPSSLSTSSSPTPSSHSSDQPQSRLLPPLVEDIRGSSEPDVLKETTLRLAYSMSLCRFVNHLVDGKQKGRTAAPVSAIAEGLGLPCIFVAIRHDATHNVLPSIHVLRDAALYAIRWLEMSYWKKQWEKVVGGRGICGLERDLELVMLLRRAMVDSSLSENDLSLILSRCRSCRENVREDNSDEKDGNENTVGRLQKELDQRMSQLFFSSQSTFLLQEALSSVVLKQWTVEERLSWKEFDDCAQEVHTDDGDDADDDDEQEEDTGNEYIQQRGTLFGKGFSVKKLNRSLLLSGRDSGRGEEEEDEQQLIDKKWKTWRPFLRKCMEGYEGFLRHFLRRIVSLILSLLEGGDKRERENLRRTGEAKTKIETRGEEEGVQRRGRGVKQNQISAQDVRWLWVLYLKVLTDKKVWGSAVDSPLQFLSCVCRQFKEEIDLYPSHWKNFDESASETDPASATASASASFDQTCSTIATATSPLPFFSNNIPVQKGRISGKGDSIEAAWCLHCATRTACLRSPSKMTTQVLDLTFNDKKIFGECLKVKGLLSIHDWMSNRELSTTSPSTSPSLSSSSSTSSSKAIIGANVMTPSNLSAESAIASSTSSGLSIATLQEFLRRKTAKGTQEEEKEAEAIVSIPMKEDNRMDDSKTNTFTHSSPTLRNDGVSNNEASEEVKRPINSLSSLSASPWRVVERWTPCPLGSIPSQRKHVPDLLNEERERQIEDEIRMPDTGNTGDGYGIFIETSIFI